MPPPSGLYPRGAPRPTTSRAEQLLHQTLATQLPEKWVAWHSLRVRASDGLEGEGDFVVAIPDRGILIIEAKGGAIEVRDGQWLQNGRVMDRPPRDQAHRFRRGLLRKLEEVWKGPTPFIHIATAFPQTAFFSGPTAGDVVGAVLGQQDLPYLREAAAPGPRERSWRATRSRGPARDRVAQRRGQGGAGAAPWPRLPRARARPCCSSCSLSARWPDERGNGRARPAPARCAGRRARRSRDEQLDTAEATDFRCCRAARLRRPWLHHGAAAGRSLANLRPGPESRSPSSPSCTAPAPSSRQR
jgi:hypothetical protein